MIQKLFSLYLPAVAVLTTASVAAVFLYQTNDPELEDVTFVGQADTFEIAPVEAIHELPLQNESISEPVTVVKVEPVVNESNEVVVVESPVEAEPSYTIVTISGPGVSIRCELELSEPATAHQVMKQAAEQCGFSYQWKKYASLGVFVDGLAGVTTNKTKGKYWIYYVNGKKANVGVSSYPIVSGDELLWKYEQEY